MRYFVITGMSGAGKTTVTRYLEDCGVFCVDNLPPMMVLKFLEACQSTSLKSDTVAMAMDVRSEEFFDPLAVSRLIAETGLLGYRVELLFLDASDEVLLSRYKETRRDHPLASATVSLTEAIAQERALLQPLREIADYIIDTSTLRPRGLQRQLEQLLTTREPGGTLRVELMSFGFKRGIPRQADLMLDVRFLPNPFYIEGLSHQTGLDAPVRDFVMSHPVTVTFMEKVTDLLDFLLPHYREEGKRRLVIAVGCTGGAHRSVAISEAIGAGLRQKGFPVNINHRDLDMEKAYWTSSGDNA